ncbi:Chemotaxis protein methyltransferase [Roseivivax jejudonensis]|uniref:Chemotaxis protein methyltransferase n=2 Tax=Roseivivax jejudonensis TaxID=1529041 RepID=A0A1X6YJG8_9RHOB|nr:Chemotaxis protein methyltransferase [Roseivivax jejudonensis]
MNKPLTSSGKLHLEQFRKLVHNATGIKLPVSKDLMIESRLRRRLVTLNMPDLDTYLGNLFSAPDALKAELPEIIDLMTTNKTDFFREQAHYRIVAERLVPEALNRAAPGQSVRYKVWSAASSTGAEAWSAAMVLAEYARKDPRLDWAIMGTDISRRVIDTARKAIYCSSELAPVPRQMRDAYLMSGRESVSERARIVPELRARVRFAELNLMDDHYDIDRGLDLIFLRNVLIYFEPEVQARVIRRISTHLRRHGYLIVGHSESMMVRQPGLLQVAPGVFRNDGGD